MYTLHYKTVQINKIPSNRNGGLLLPPQTAGAVLEHKAKSSSWALWVWHKKENLWINRNRKQDDAWTGGWNCAPFLQALRNLTLYFPWKWRQWRHMMTMSCDNLRQQATSWCAWLGLSEASGHNLCFTMATQSGNTKAPFHLQSNLELLESHTIWGTRALRLVRNQEFPLSKASHPQNKKRGKSGRWDLSLFYFAKGKRWLILNTNPALTLE